MLFGLFSKKKRNGTLLNKKDGKLSVASINNQKSKGESCSLDLEDNMMQIFVRHESICQHQPIRFERSTEGHRITLGKILSTLFNISEKEVVSMGVCEYATLSHGNDNANTTIEIPNFIWNFDVWSCVLKNKDENGHYVNLPDCTSILMIKTTTRNCIVVINGRGGGITEKYLRMTIMMPAETSVGNLVSSNISTATNVNRAYTNSFILAYSEPSNGELLARYKAIEKCVLEKMKVRNFSFTRIEQAYINGQYEFEYSDYIPYGKWLLSQKRFYDAYTINIRAYKYLKHEIYSCNNGQMKDAYYEICHDLGNILQHLGKYATSVYFLKQAALGNNSFENDYKIAETRFYNVIKEQRCKYTNSCDSTITIGYILQLLLDVDIANIKCEVTQYDIALGKHMKVPADIVEALCFPLNNDEARNKVFVFSRSHSLVNENDESILCFDAPLIIATQDVQSEDGVQFIKVDIMSCNFETNDDKKELGADNKPENVTVILSSTSGLTFGKSIDEIKSCIDYAEWLRGQHLTVEAYKMAMWGLENILPMLSQEKKSVDKHILDLYYKCAYEIGWNLMDLGKQEEAVCYLEIASKSLDALYIQEYINGLVNLRDPRSLSIIDYAFSHYPKPKDESLVQHWNAYMAFLKRRKAYVLIDQGRLDEAEHLLQTLIKEPLCQDFAIGELKYIEEFKKRTTI